MHARYIALFAMLATGILASDRPSDHTRNRDDDRRAKEKEAARQRDQAKKEAARRKAQDEKNAGGYPKKGGVGPKRSKRSLDDIVRRAIDDALLEDSLYSRALYDEDDLYARDAELDFDDLYY